VPPPRTDEAADESNIGSKNYAKAPEAILLGGGYMDDDIAQMREASKDVMAIPWIRPDLTKAAPPSGTREYGLALVERTKDVEGVAGEGLDGEGWGLLVLNGEVEGFESFIFFSVS
jgi:hypothetical protein